MPSILTHPAVPLAIALGLGRGVVSWRLLAAGMIVSALPDGDVVSFPLGIPYESAWGHRGFTHSLAIALLPALLVSACARWLGSRPAAAFWFLLASGASHGLLDSLTNGGLGIAFLWPWSSDRFFAPFRPIEVAPIGLSGFLSARGVSVLCSEMLWVWFPALALGFFAAAVRRRRSGTVLSR